jgi:CBS domain-containing protein
MGGRVLVRVWEVMKPEVDVLDGMLTVAEAIRSLKHPENKSFIVQKRHEDDEFGMVLVSDIGRLVLARDRTPERVNVYEIMTKPVIQVRPSMDIRYCARLFDHHRLSRAPVVDDDKVIGVVSFTDLVLRGMSRMLR